VAPLAAVARLAVVPRDALIEMDAGSWTGARLATLRRRRAWATVQRRPSEFGFPGGGERFDDARDRVTAEVERIARRHRRGRVAIATHGDLVRILLAGYAGAPLDEFQRIVVDPASVSVVALDGTTARVLLVNDVGGLERFAGLPTGPWEASAQSDGAKLGG
jgi:probable phosphoglycerate mutase